MQIVDSSVSCGLRLSEPTFPRATLGTDAAFRRSRKDTPPGQFVWEGRKVSVRPALRGNRPDVPCVG